MKTKIPIILLIVVTIFIGENFTFSAVRHTVKGTIYTASHSVPFLHEGGPASNAEVTITNLNTHAVWTTQAGHDGRYQIDNITNPGDYKIDAEGEYTVWVGYYFPIPVPTRFTGQVFFTIPVGQTTTTVDLTITF